VLHGLPPQRVEAVKRLAARVDWRQPDSCERQCLLGDSRLIGQQVEVRLYVGHLEVWYGQKRSIPASPAGRNGIG